MGAGCHRPARRDSDVDDLADDGHGDLPQKHLTHSSLGIYRWNGIDLQPQLLEAAWWVAFVLLGVALFGRWSRGALVRIGALFIVFTFVFVFLPGPPFHGPPSSGPVIGPLESPSP